MARLSAGFEESIAVQTKGKMRIAIAGASGTGKTTLAKAISERFTLPLNPIGARTVAKDMGFDNPYDVDAAGKRVEFQKRLFEAKRDWELAHDSFVTDRTYLDNLTYCALHMVEHLEDNAVDVFTKAMGRYQILFFLPRRAFSSLGDGVRKTSAVYHEIYERLLTGFIYSGQRRHLVVPVCPGFGLLKDRGGRETAAFYEIDRWMEKQ